MGDRSKIEWTDATWNPVTGCTKVTRGCDNCYAESLAHGKLKTVYGARLPVVDTPENRANTFAVRLWPERVDQPIRWKRPRLIFVNSMSDLFHADVPDDYVRDLFRVMEEADHHIYQVLTKRPARAARFLHGKTLPGHIWIGTSVEDQAVTYRIDHLRAVDAQIRFLSCEPLLGPIETDLTGIHWVIAGGESGPRYRPVDLEWVRGLRDQCQDQGVAFHFKQVGGRTPKAGGRDLDGRTWDEMPAALRTADTDTEED